MPSNITVVGGATQADIYLGNYTYANIAASMAALRFKLATDLNRIVYKNAAGASYKLLTDASTSANHPATRILYTDANGAATSNSAFVFNGASVTVPALIVTNLTASRTVETDSSNNIITAAKNTGYNLNLGTSAGTVSEGNHTHSGMITGAGAAGRVAFWTAADVIDDDTDFAYDTTGKVLGISSSLTTLPRFQLTNTNDDGSNSSIRFIKNPATAGTSDILGAIEFYNDDSAGTQIQYVQVAAQSVGVTAGSTSGRLAVIAKAAGTDRTYLDISGSLNRVELGDVNVSTTQTIIKCGGSSSVRIDVGATTGLATFSSGAVTLASAATGAPVLTLRNTNADATSAVISFDKSSASQAADDALGKLAWYGKDDGGGQEQFAELEVTSPIIFNGNESGKISIAVRSSGSLRNFVTLNGETADIQLNSLTGEIVLDSGQLIFRENGAAAYFTAYPGNIIFNSAVTAEPEFILRNTNTDSAGPRLSLEKTSSSSAAANDNIGYIYARGYDSANNLTDYANINFQSTVVTNGSEAGAIYINAAREGVLRTAIAIDPNASNGVIIGFDSTTGAYESVLVRAGSGMLINFSIDNIIEAHFDAGGLFFDNGHTIHPHYSATAPVYGEDGGIYVDGTNSRIYAKIAGTWKYAVLI